MSWFADSIRRLASFLGTLALILVAGCTSSVGEREDKLSARERFGRAFVSPLQQVGTSRDIPVDITIPAAESAAFLSAEAPEAPFSFKGGSYPGTGGSCGSQFTGACRLVFSFSPTAVGEFSGRARINFQDGEKVGVFEVALTGSGALALGQPDLQTNHHLVRGFRSPGSVSSAGGLWMVADAGNHRVLIFTQNPITGIAPSIVLGQPNLEARLPNNGGLSARSLYFPSSVYTDGTRIIVADNLNHRVLIWKKIPNQNFREADYVIGQPHMKSASPNSGGVSGKSLNSPTFASWGGGRLLVSDTGNNRVLVWNSIPESSFQEANWLIGQPNFQSNAANAGGLSEFSLQKPVSAKVIGNDIFVVDTYNQRILKFPNNQPATGTQIAATLVIGQADFTHNSANAGGIADKSLYTPYDICEMDGRLFVADNSNSRILEWIQIPSTNHASAQIVFGKSQMNVGGVDSDNPTAHSLWSPTNVTCDAANDKLIVTDRANNRILVWDRDDVLGSDARQVIGQSSFTSNIENGSSTDQSGFGHSLHADSNGAQVFVVDTAAHRVLIWNKAPEDSTTPPDVVLGQPNFHSYLPNKGGLRKGLSSPRSVLLAGGKLFVADAGNHRVLVYNSVPAVNHAEADGVIGQANLNGSRPNRGQPAPSASSLNIPSNIAYDGKYSYICDYANHRVLVYDGLLTSSAAASFVLGQADFVSGAANRGGSVGPNTLYYPNWVASNGEIVAVADMSNHRVLFWNRETITTVGDAVIALGQPNKTSRVARSTLQGLSSPTSLTFSNEGIFVVDSGNNRVLGWNDVPLDGRAPDGIIGEGASAPAGTLASLVLARPFGIAVNNGRLFVADSFNDRALILPAPSGAKKPLLNPQADF